MSQDRLTEYTGDASRGLGAKTPKCDLDAIVKHTGGQIELIRK